MRVPMVVLGRGVLLLLTAALVPACGRSRREGGAASPARVAFAMDSTTPGVYELFAADLAGGPITNLSGTLVPGSAGVFFFAWSPDRSRIAFVAEKDIAGTRELYIVHASGGSPVNVSAGRTPLSVAWAPDGSRLAYTSFLGVEPPGLFCCNPDGSANARISALPDPTSGVLGFKWAPDGSRLAFEDSDSPLNLYSVRPDGTGHAEVTGGTAYVYDYRWSPDGRSIACQTTASTYDLFVARADGSSLVMLSGPMVPGGGAIPGMFEWSPDGTRLAYLAKQNSYATELFTTLADGSGNVRIPSLSAGSRGVDQFSWSPDGRRLAYRGSTIFPPADTVELYTALPDGTGELNLSQSGALALGSHLWSPDSTTLAFELYGQLRTVRATGGAISDPAPGSLTSQYYYKWAPDSSRLAFVVATSPHDLFTCLPDGTGVNPISGPFAAGAGVGLSFSWSSDSSRLVYLTDQDTVGVQELFSAPATGGPIKLSGALPPGSIVGWFSVN